MARSEFPEAVGNLRSRPSRHGRRTGAGSILLSRPPPSSRACSSSESTRTACCSICTPP